MDVINEFNKKIPKEYRTDQIITEDPIKFIGTNSKGQLLFEFWSTSAKLGEGGWKYTVAINNELPTNDYCILGAIQLVSIYNPMD